jgi:hypothetical protein
MPSTQWRLVRRLKRMAADPAAIVAVIAMAATVSRPKARYAATAAAKIIFFLR